MFIVFFLSPFFTFFAGSTNLPIIHLADREFFFVENFIAILVSFFCYIGPEENRIEKCNETKFVNGYLSLSLFVCLFVSLSL